MAAAAATAVASISAGSVEDLERFVEAGAISGLTRGLASGYADEAAACAAALAVIARLPSAHSHLLRSGACDVILRCAGSRVRHMLHRVLPTFNCCLERYAVITLFFRGNSALCHSCFLSCSPEYKGQNIVVHGSLLVEYTLLQVCNTFSTFCNS